MKEYMSYATFSKDGSGSLEMEIPGMSGDQFIMTDIYATSSADDLRVWSCPWIALGIQPFKTVAPIVAGQKTMALDAVTKGTVPLTIDLQPGRKIYIRSNKFTQIFSMFAYIDAVDPVTKIITTDKTWSADEVAFITSGSEVFMCEEHTLPMDSDGVGGYIINRTGEAVGSAPFSSSQQMVLYGTNVKMRIAGYYDDME